MAERDGTEQKLALFLVDLVAFFGALNAAIYLRYYVPLPVPFGREVSVPPYREIFLAFPFVVLAWAVVGAMFGSYRARQSALEEISAVVRAALVDLPGDPVGDVLLPRLFVLARHDRLLHPAGAAGRDQRPRRLPGAAAAGAVALCGALERGGARAQQAGEALLQAMAEDRDYYEVVGRVDAGDGGGESAVPVIGNLGDLERLCAERRFDTLVLVDRLLPEEAVLESIEYCLRHQVHWNVIPGVHDLLLDRARVDLVDGIPLVGMRRTNIVGFNWMLKRAVRPRLRRSSLLLLGGAADARRGVPSSSPRRARCSTCSSASAIAGKVFPFFKFRSMHSGNDDGIHREFTKKWITEARRSPRTVG